MPETELLATILRGTSSLPEALCRGQHQLFDPDLGHESGGRLEWRHKKALALCRSCPELTPCAEWLNSLPKRDRPGGVVAGLVFDNPKRGRPRKENGNAA